ncbi:hypothetical protein ACS0TY_014005 [Phlomoides rotata]
MARKRKRVPEVLRRVFGRRARTLADTILALIPPPPPDMKGRCRCNRRRCLSCVGSNAMSFLVRSGDSLDYRNLLNGCFVVVSQNAPPLTAFVPQCRWSQREIVRRSIEIILHEQPSSSNLICCSYNKTSRSSAVVDALTSANWIVLLRRVGDALMMYLLRYTSLFLPLSRMQRHQIAGCPINDLCFEPPRQKPEPKPLPHPLAYNGSKKRKLVEGDESIPRKQICTYSLGCDPSLNSSTVVAGTGSSCASKEDLSHNEREESSKGNALASHKRTRQYRWQRQRKRRQFVVQGAPSLIPCGRNHWNNDKLSSCASSCQRDQGKLSHCICCSVFQIEPKVNRNAEIGRRNIFYKLENSTSTFPGKHILHTLKPNASGAAVLFSNIFETCVIDKNAGAVACSHEKNGPINSTCLYHSFTKLLKSIIRSSQNCRFLRLLEKHCPISTSYQDSSSGPGTGLEGNDLGANLSTSRQDATEGDGKLFFASNTQNSNTVTKATTDQVKPSMFCPKKDVVSFLWAICRRIVPSPLLGEPSNWRILRRNISKFIHLRRFEKFSLKECTYKLKITKFPLFSNLHTGRGGLGVTDIARHAIFDCWIFWFFAHLVSPLVQANFYVTETDHEKQEVLYYRKSAWEKMMREAECLRDNRYSLLNHASTRKIICHRLFGFSRARLRPKQNGLRILTNLGAPSRFPTNLPSSEIHSNQNLRRKAFCNEVPYRFFKSVNRSFDFSRARLRPKQNGLRIPTNLGAPSRFPTHLPFSEIHSNQRLRKEAFCKDEVTYQLFKSVNSVLHDFHVILKGLMAKEPEKLGSSVFDYNDAYRKLVPFLFLLKNGSSNVPNVFMVVSDVLKAFDSVNQDKLISVMKDVIVDDKFTLEKFTQVICKNKSLIVHEHQTLAHQDIVTASARIGSRFRAHSSDSVFVKKGLRRRIRKEEIFSMLKEHIKHNVVKLGNNFYLQNVGIPQGSVLSSLLCSIYYGHMESNVLFPFLEKANRGLSGTQDPPGISVSGGNHQKDIVVRGSEYLMLRLIDDFLFISTSKKQASMFLSRMERGIGDYNCLMNQEKYGINFITSDGQERHSNKRHVGKDGISFLQWSGLLVNCSTLEIQADYTRYLNCHLSCSLTVISQGKVGTHLKKKLRRFLRPKCHPLLYDSNINSPGVVRLNIYQAFLLSGMKLLCYISNLSTLPKFTPNFFINGINACLRYMKRLIKRRMYSFEINPAAFRPKYYVKPKEVVLLGLYAYRRVMRKKQSRYRDVLLYFDSKLKAYGKVESMSNELKYALDDAHSSVLWTIKY